MSFLARKSKSDKPSKDKVSKKKKDDKKEEKKEELPPPKPVISTSGGWQKSSNRPDDAIIALLKSECDKKMAGEGERKTIAVVKKEEEVKKEEPKLNAAGEEEDSVEEGLIISGRENGKPIIKGGNIEKLVEYLTHHIHSDQKYLNAFMLTFRSFTTPKELLTLLFQRFTIETIDGVQEDNFKRMIKVIRLRVSNVIKNWVSNSFYDFEEDAELLKTLEDFIGNEMISALGSSELSPAVNLQKLIAKMKNPEERRREKSFSDKPPVPHLPKNIGAKDKMIPILTYHPEELARQLTLIDYNLFIAIKPSECLNQNWMHKTQKEELAPNILSMIRRFNDVSTWVASEILKCKDLVLRTKVLKHIIEIAEFCKNLNNFNTVMEIISGLQSSSVFRLKQTWGGLSKNYVKSFEEMKELMSQHKNYHNFRQYLHNVNPPCIPYLGMYLTDLTFIEEGNKDNLPDGSINFAKRKRLAEVIAEIQTYQYTPYCLDEVSFIKEYILGAESLPEEQCYKLSLKREGRGGETVNEDEQEDDEPFGEMEKISGYNFDDPDTDNVIVFDKNYSSSDSTSFVPIASASLVKLVERLTYHKYQDIDFLSSFLMTLNTFTTPQEFFNLLVLRYNIPKPKNPSKQQLALFTKSRLMPIHLRLYNVVKTWMTTYIEDFIGNNEFITKVNETLANWSESNKQLSNTVEGIKNLFTKKLRPEPEPEVILIGHKNDGKLNEDLNITNYSADELTKNICLLEQAIFSNVKPRECLFVHDQNLMKENSPTLLKMKKNFELTKNWATSEFLKQNDLESRVAVLTLLINTSDKLIQQKNFNSSMAIVAGIKSIQNELENSLLWSYVAPTVLNIFKQIEQYYKNPSTLKNMEKAPAPVPTIPYLENHLKHLNTIQSQPDHINQLINYEKRRNMYDIYKTWYAYIQEPYSEYFEKSKCWDYLMNVHIFSPIEISKKASTLERVADPKLLDLRNKLRADSIDGCESLGDSPRGKAEELSLVKSSLLGLMSEEKEIMQEIITIAKKELAQELMAELKQYTVCVRDEIAITNHQLGLPSNVEDASERIVSRKFPGALIVPVTETDKEGMVFGWEEEFTLYQVDAEEKWLVYITPKVLKSDLSTAFKIFKFFRDNSEGCKERYCAILTSRVTDEATDIATRFGCTLSSFI